MILNLLFDLEKKMIFEDFEAQFDFQNSPLIEHKALGYQGLALRVHNPEWHKRLKANSRPPYWFSNLKCSFGTKGGEFE